MLTISFHNMDASKIYSCIENIFMTKIYMEQKQYFYDKNIYGTEIYIQHKYEL